MFNTNRLMSDMKSRAVRGSAITLAGQITARGIQVVVIVILARLLTPDDFGLIAMIMAIVGFVSVFKDFGLSVATIQRSEVTHEQISCLFWINAGLGVVNMLVVMAMAPAIAWFYGRPQLTVMTLALSVTFLFSGLSVQHQALLCRQMRFGILVGLQLMSIVIGSVVGLTMAALGAGVWALVCMSLTNSAVEATGKWLVCRWCPGLPSRSAQVRSMLRFGWNLLGTKVVCFLGRHVDDILIGKVWGAAQLGFYDRAYRLLLMPLGQINVPVAATAIPTLSRLQESPERYRRYYMKALSMIAFLTMPLVMYMIVMSKELVTLVLGPHWSGAADIFSIFGFAALIQPILSTTGWLYVSLGRADRMLRWAVFECSAMVVSFFIGLPYGAKGVALSYTLCNFAICIPSLWYASRQTPVMLRDMCVSLSRPLLATLVAGVVLALSKGALFGLLSSTSRLLALFVGVLVVVTVYMASMCTATLSLGPLSDIVEILRQLKLPRAVRPG